jgi:electron transport complex protein RnfC
MKPAGTLVSRGDSLFSSPVDAATVPRAPVDGKIVGQELAPITRDVYVPVIRFEPTSKENVQSEKRLTRDQIAPMMAALSGVSSDELADRLAALSVWADRWASPNLLAQLRGPHRKPIDTILCNVLDEDPAVPLQANVAADWPVEVVAGVMAIATACKAKNVLTVVAYAGPSECWHGLRAASADTSMRLIPLVNEYPKSHPSILVHELTRRRIAPGELPSDRGVLVLDAAAAVAVGRAIASNEPMLSCPIAVHDYLRRKTHYFDVPIGTRVDDLLAQMTPAGAFDLRAGCPLREVKLNADCVIGGDELTIAIVPPQAAANVEPCIRCAWCAEGCPVYIRPAALLDAAQQEDLYVAAQNGMDACIECGICSFVCPSHLPLLPAIRTLQSLQEGTRSHKPQPAEANP